MDVKELDNKTKKLEEKVGESFSEEVKVASKEKLNELVTKISKEIEDLNEKEKADEQIRMLKEKMKALTGGYKDTRKYLSLKRQYIFMVLMGRGNL